MAAIKSARDNHLGRMDAGISASVLLSCARAVALQERYDHYEPIIVAYNKFRGTAVHGMMEDPDPPDHIIEERRVERVVDVDGFPFRISGKPDRADKPAKLLIDYKSCHTVPTKIKKRHKYQLSIYRYLLADGVFVDTGEVCQVPIERAGIHYITWQTKVEKAWRKVPYELYPLEEIEDFIIERARPIKQWQETKELPACNDLEPSRYWDCDCIKLTKQLKELGTWDEEA